MKTKKLDARQLRQLAESIMDETPEHVTDEQVIDSLFVDVHNSAEQLLDRLDAHSSDEARASDSNVKRASGLIWDALEAIGHAGSLWRTR